MLQCLYLLLLVDVYFTYSVHTHTCTYLPVELNIYTVIKLCGFLFGQFLLVFHCVFLQNTVLLDYTYVAQKSNRHPLATNG